MLLAIEEKPDISGQKKSMRGLSQDGFAFRHIHRPSPVVNEAG